jgi:anthranilate/para-aminobenzoate synthase component I
VSIIGSLAAFDHWRQRVYLIESVPVLDLSSDELDQAYDSAIGRVERAVADLARPLAYVPVAPPQADDVMPEVRSTMPNGMFQQAVEVAKEHIVEGDIFQVVLSQRYDIDLDADPFDFYRVPDRSASRTCTPQASASRSSGVRRADGAIARAQGDQRPIAGTRRVKRRRPTAGWR